MSRPDKLPSWTDDDAASKSVEMESTKKLGGWIYKERMAFQYLNWLFRHFVKWVLHIDESINQFDPHASFPADEFINVTAGRVNSGVTVIEQALQQIDFTGLFPTAASTSRIDRIVIDNSTGVISRIAGTQAGSPTAPDIDSGKTSICQVLIDENTSSIESTAITDERLNLKYPLLDEDDLISDSDRNAPTQQSVKTYVDDKKIILTTPVEILNTATPIAFTLVDMSTVYAPAFNAEAKIAVIKIYVTSSNTTNTASAKLYLRTTGSGLATNEVSLYCVAEDTASSGTRQSESVTVTDIKLDENSDFDYSVSSPTGLVNVQIHILGYYT